MRTLLALALLSSSASAALLNTPADGYMRLRLTPGHGDWRGSVDTGAYIFPFDYTPAFTTGPYGETFGNTTSRSLWINTPHIATWNMGFDNVPFYHDFSIELALGIPELAILDLVRQPEPLRRSFTYSAPGYVRQALATFTPSPEPGAAGMMVVAAVLCLWRRAQSPGRG